MSKLRQHLPLTLRLSLVPLSLATTYLAQLDLFVHDQKWVSASLYAVVGLTMVLLVAWDHLKVPVQFMYSCFFKRIGHHGNDQQSRLESFYQDQAKSKS